MSIMQPETAREAWERGVEDAERFAANPNSLAWRELTGYDPTEPGYEGIFERFARDWRAGFTYGMTETGRKA